ncbi:MAG: hypothetical protein BWY57_01619 [Betaproteobacteria bacterium ADurb.Bin341]|nr:MAG: hypothetical protein BWY57_01619 [Betaproteobacteria bacterium ADurb.Bin341]
MSAAIHRRILERRAAIENARRQEAERAAFLAAAKGEQGKDGQDGEKGDKPKHEWKGTALRFENPDGTWGKLVDLKGDPGRPGRSGSSGGLDLAALPPAANWPQPDTVIVRQNGQWVMATLEQWLAWQTAPQPVTVNGETVSINGQAVTVRG